MEEINRLCEQKRVYVQSIKNLLFLEQSQEISLKSLRQIKTIDSGYDIEQDLKNIERYSRESIYNLQKTKINYSFKENSYVYFLKLANDKYYIGFSVDVVKRLTQHFSGDGAKWTQLHPPVSIVSIIPGDKTQEKIITLKYMKKYGWENVRGGPWCLTMMNTPPKELNEDSK